MGRLAFLQLKVSTPPQSPEPFPSLLLSQRPPHQGTSMVGSWPHGPPSRWPRSPPQPQAAALCCSPGTSHTLARRLQNLPLPPRGPDPCQNHMGSWKGSARPPASSLLVF